MAHKENNTNQNPKDDAENQDSGQQEPKNETSHDEEVNPFKLFPVAKKLSSKIEKPKDDEDPFDGVEFEFISKRAFLSFIRSTIKAKKGGFLGFIEDIQAQKKQGGFLSSLNQKNDSMKNNPNNSGNQNYNNPNNSGNQNYNNPNNSGNQNYNNPNNSGNQNYNNPNNGGNSNYGNQNYNNPNNGGNPNYGNQNYNNPNNGGNPNYNNANTNVQNYNNPNVNSIPNIGPVDPNKPIVPVKEDIDPFDDLAERMAKAQEAVENIHSTFNAALNVGPTVKVISDDKEDPNADGFKSLNDRLFYDRTQRVKATEEEKKEILNKLDYLETQVQLDAFKYRGFERKSKNWALIFRLLSSALAAVVTVLLGINITDTLRDWAVDWWINTIALIITAFISIIGVIQGFFDANELYIKYTDTANKLEHLYSTIEYLKCGIDLKKADGGEDDEVFITLEQVNAVKIEYDEIIESTHDYEVRVKTKEQEKLSKTKPLDHKSSKSK